MLKINIWEARVIFLFPFKLQLGGTPGLTGHEVWLRLAPGRATHAHLVTAIMLASQHGLLFVRRAL